MQQDSLGAFSLVMMFLFVVLSLLFAEQNGRQLIRAADFLQRLEPQPVPEGRP